MSVGMDIYIPLSIVMFLEYAVWGAWAPVLAARLLGPLKMTGKQTGWIYATLPLSCIVAPLVAGQLADRWLNAEWILAAAHLIGAVLLFVAARRQTFVSLFLVMLCYSFCYAATLPLVNAALFAHVDDDATRALVFIWAPVAWALVGYTLTGWRMTRKTEGDGSDCLIYAGSLSVLMALGCLLLPATPPAGTGEVPIVQAFSMLSQPNFLIFIVISMVVAGLMQFYFLGSAQFMQDIGIASKHVPASMAIAQAAQAVATLLIMVPMFTNPTLGFKWTLTIGAACWCLMYVIYVGTKPRWLIVAAQSLHGLAYVLFIIVGQIFANAVAPPEIRGSVQALIFAATVGVGLFLGTQLAGIVMDRFAVEGKFQWRKVWLVPCLIMLAGVLALALALREPPKEENALHAAPGASNVVAQSGPSSTHRLGC